MSTPFSAAASAYGAAQRLMGQATNPVEAEPKPNGAGGDFAQMLASSMDEVLQSGRAADQKAMELVNGNANVVDVVTAISETEIALETMVTVRDKVIAAYEEIMRMPI